MANVASGIPDIKFMFMSYSDIRLLFRVRRVWGTPEGPKVIFSLGGALRRPLSGQGRTGIANHLHAPQATGPLPSMDGSCVDVTKSGSIQPATMTA